MDTKITEPIFTQLPNGDAVTLIPFNSIDETPKEIVNVLFKLLNDIIIEGTTYVQEEPLTFEGFKSYYFPNFVAILFEGHVKDPSNLSLDQYPILGSFYIKPNYVGRSSHICNAGFIVNRGLQGKGVGKTMGKLYLNWAPKLGYTYSVFNLVYKTNIASIKIWEGLGFDRIGLVPEAGRMKGSDELVDAILFGKRLI